MQFSNIYGVGNKTGNLVSYTLGELMAGKEAAFGPALQPYDFIYVDDFSCAIESLLQNYFKCLGEIVNVSSGESISLKQII